MMLHKYLMTNNAFGHNSSVLNHFSFCFIRTKHNSVVFVLMCEGGYLSVSCDALLRGHMVVNFICAALVCV